MASRRPARRALLAAPLLLLVSALPARAQSGWFGNAVVVADGELLIAEPTTSFRPGTVYIHRKEGGTWSEAARLRAPDAERADGFGSLLALAGPTLFVGQRGQPRLHMFAPEGTSWRHAGILETGDVTGASPGCGDWGECGTDFGLSLAADDDWLFLGEPGVASGGGGRGGAPPRPPAPGAVHVFHRGAGGSWAAHGRLVPGDGHPGDRFGAAIAVEQGRALVGAPGWSTGGDEPVEAAGRVYEFLLEGGAWREGDAMLSRPEQNAAFGEALALDGEVAVVGAPGGGDGHGEAFLYRLSPETGGWTSESRLAAFSGLRGDRFGAAVAIVGDEVWVGAPAPRGIDMGTVYVFEGLGDGPALAGTRRLGLTDTVHRDAFGDRIAAAPGLVAVSATGMHHRAGAVLVYERSPSGQWTDPTMLVSEHDALEALTGEEHRCPLEGSVGLFDCQDVELLAFVPVSALTNAERSRGVRTNDNWGWTDPETGREYALVGRNDGTSFVDITDPVNPVLVGDLPKTPDTPPSQLWRDIKVYRDHAYIVADGAGAHGMQVFDLRRLRDVPVVPQTFEPDLLYTRVNSVHNIAINGETGYAYLVGAGGGGETCGGGLHMVDIREPLNPRFAGCFRDERGTHDVQCTLYRGPDERYRGREICLKSNGQQFAISDVTDKANPVALSRVSHPNPAYLHQGWLTEDHRYFFMDDESDVNRGIVPTTRTLVWDVSDLEDPVLAKEFMGSLPAAAHNLYIKGNLMYQANYRYGLQIVDVSDPLNPVEVGHFDTSPFHTGPGWGGAWSNYPFFESGTIIVTSMQEGLFVLKRRTPIP